MKVSKGSFKCPELVDEGMHLYFEATLTGTTAVSHVCNEKSEQSPLTALPYMDLWCV